MGWSDPFPGRELLTASEVRKLFGFSDAREFDEFTKETTIFPRPVACGKTKQGKPRLKYLKSKVLAYLDLLGSQ